MTKQAMKLKNDIQKLKNNWNERDQFKLKGVGNLSVADLDQLELYADEYIRNNGSFGTLMSPLGDTKIILDKYNLKGSTSIF